MIGSFWSPRYTEPRSLLQRTCPGRPPQRAYRAPANASTSRCSTSCTASKPSGINAWISATSVPRSSASGPACRRPTKCTWPLPPTRSTVDMGAASFARCMALPQTLHSPCRGRFPHSQRTLAHTHVVGLGTRMHSRKWKAHAHPSGGLLVMERKNLDRID